MPRLIRKTLILAKIETASGTDAVPTGALNALQVSDLSITPLDAQNIELNYIRAFYGNAESLVGPASVKCSFTVSLAGAGLAATAPAWGPLLVGCGNAETTGLTTPARVEYLPVTDLLKTLTIYWYDDGVLHKLLGAFGTVKLSAKSGEAPKLMFEFTGLDGGITAVPNAVGALAAWKTPPAVTRANTVDVTLGCSYAAGVLTGGTAYNSTGLTLDWGNTVEFAAMLTTEQVLLSDRKATGTVSLELSAVQELALMASVRANTTTSLGFVIGITSGNQILIHLPAVQLIAPKKEELSGMRLIGFDLRVMPLAGNDEIRIVSL